MINKHDISFVIQGELKPEIYPQITKKIRHFFPDAEIIFASYIGTSVAGLDYDKLVLVEDPGGFFYGVPNAKPNNVNRQIATTLAGLKAATRKFAFKLRSDFIINGNGFLDFFDTFEKSDSKYKVFEKKILSCVFFARNPRKGQNPLPFHPSDIAFFGLRSDLLNLFDIPFMQQDETAYHKDKKDKNHHYYVPEQHLWINCLRKNGKNIVCDHQRDCNASIAEETERYSVSNFIYLDYNQFNLIAPKKLLLFWGYNNDFEDVITHIEWQGLYKSYIDNSHIVPEQDKVRDNIVNKSKRIKQYERLAKCIVFWIPLKGIRRGLRSRLAKYMIKHIQL